LAAGRIASEGNLKSLALIIAFPNLRLPPIELNLSQE